jgi:hypothetical protein
MQTLRIFQSCKARIQSQNARILGTRFFTRRFVWKEMFGAPGYSQRA